MPTIPQAQGLQPTANIVFTPNRNVEASLAVSIGNTPGIPEQDESQLITHGTYLAIWLVKTLDTLKKRNPNAIYPIMSILEPYTETDQELDLQMPPKSSRRVILNVTNKGRAKPNLSIE